MKANVIFKTLLSQEISQKLQQECRFGYGYSNSSADGQILPTKLQLIEHHEQSELNLIFHSSVAFGGL